MHPTQLHMLLNHFPTIGFGIGLALFVVALFAKHDDLKRVSLVMFFIAAALTITTYVTGNDAAQSIKELPGISVALIDSHETAALGALILMQITGFFAWLGLWLWRQSGRLPNWNSAVILVLSIVTFAVTARAANLGGEIRHAEIAGIDVPAQNAGGEEPTTINKAFGSYVEQHSWVWPTSETLHFIGLCLLLGVVLTIDLRILGIGKSLSFSSLFQLLPLGMLGFLMNLVTGMVFFVATPHQYTGYLFFLKMVLVVLGGINVLYFMLLNKPWTIDEGVDAPITAKLVAASAIVIWMAVLFCGHMLPFLGNSF